MIIHVLRKPLDGTVAANALTHGTGALNIDGCRIGTDGGSTQPSGMDRYNARLAEQGYRPGAYQKGKPAAPQPSGRWPSNILLDEAAAAKLDEQVPNAGGGYGISGGSPDGNGIYSGSFPRGDRSVVGYGDGGGASRFFQKVDL